MNLLLAWLVTSTEFLLIDTASALRIFRDLANQGLKIDFKRVTEIEDVLKDDFSLNSFIEMFIPVYNFYKTYCDIRDYNDFFPYIIKDLYMMGLLTKMSDFELQEYAKNPSVLNAIRAPITCAKRLENAYTLELSDEHYPSKIWFEILNTNGQTRLEILQAEGPIAALTTEEQKETIEFFMLSYVLETKISLKNIEKDLSLEDQEKILEAYQETKDEEEKNNKLTRKKK